MIKAMDMLKISYGVGEHTVSRATYIKYTEYILSNSYCVDCRILLISWWASTMRQLQPLRIHIWMPSKRYGPMLAYKNATTVEENTN